METLLLSPSSGCVAAAVVGSALLTWGVTSQEGSAIKALWASGMALVLSMTFPGYIGKVSLTPS